MNRLGLFALSRDGASGPGLGLSRPRQEEASMGYMSTWDLLRMNAVSEAIGKDLSKSREAVGKVVKITGPVKNPAGGPDLDRTEEMTVTAELVIDYLSRELEWGSTGSATPDIDSRLRSIDETLLALLHEVQDTTRYCDITRCDGQAPMRINISDVGTLHLYDNKAWLNRKSDSQEGLYQITRDSYDRLMAMTQDRVHRNDSPTDTAANTVRRPS